MLFRSFTNRSADPDPLRFHLHRFHRPSWAQAHPVHSNMSPQEAHAFFHDDENLSSDHSTVPSSLVYIQPPDSSTFRPDFPNFSSDPTILGIRSMSRQRWRRGGDIRSPHPCPDRSDYVLADPGRTPLVLLQVSVDLVATDTLNCPHRYS